MMTTLTAPPVARGDGLSSDAAARRLGEVGPNRLAETRRQPAWRRFADQFRNPLVVILLGAVVLAALVGDVKDATVIAVIVVANAVLGFVQERRAEQSLEALQRMLVTQARVRRDGTTRLVDAEEIVPDDLVLVDAGDRIPADGAWVAAHDLAVDEASLTGESDPVAKHAGDDGFVNTVLTRGRGELVVTATGSRRRCSRTGRRGHPKGPSDPRRLAHRPSRAPRWPPGWPGGPGAGFPAGGCHLRPSLRP